MQGYSIDRLRAGDGDKNVLVATGEIDLQLLACAPPVAQLTDRGHPSQVLQPW